MGSSSSGMPRARLLTAALRQALEDAKPKLSQRQLAQKLGLAHTTVGRWLSGDVLPSAEDVSAILAVLEVSGDGRNQIMELARSSSDADWLASGPLGISQQLAGAMDCERTARTMVECGPLIIPGMLQTSEYARAIIGGKKGSPHTDTRVTLRMGRRDVITRDDPATLEALIGMPAIRGGIGGPKVMAGQLRLLLKLIEDLESLTVRVFPVDGEWHPGHAGPFIHYTFGPGVPDIVLLEHHRTGVFLVDREDVAAYNKAADEIREVAMSPEASAELIADVLSTSE